MAKPKIVVTYAQFHPAEIPAEQTCRRSPNNQTKRKSQYRDIWEAFIASGHRCVSSVFLREEDQPYPVQAKAVYNALFKVCPKDCRVIRRGEEVFLLRLESE